MRKAGILWVIGACNLTLLALLLCGGSFLQDRYQGSRSMGATEVSVGQAIPPTLAERFGSKRVLLLIFPSCRECTLESPDALIGQHFERRVVVLLPGASPGEIDRYRGRFGHQNDYDGALPALAIEDPDWYINYGGGTMLKCPEGKYPEWSGYVITAGTGTGTDAGIGSRLAQEWADCRAKRGDAYPWVYDSYHHMRVDAYQGGGQKVLLVRANGSAQTVPFREWGPWAPCARDIMVEVSH